MDPPVPCSYRPLLCLLKAPDTSRLRAAQERRYILYSANIDLSCTVIRSHIRQHQAALMPYDHQPLDVFVLHTTLGMVHCVWTVWVYASEHVHVWISKKVWTMIRHCQSNVPTRKQKSEYSTLGGTFQTQVELLICDTWSIVKILNIFVWSTLCVTSSPICFLQFPECLLGTCPKLFSLKSCIMRNDVWTVPG